MGSRRLRKKLYLGEFAVFGFALECELKTQTTHEDENFIDDLLTLLEQRGLCFAGGGDATFSGFVSHSERYGSASNADREVVQAWFENSCRVSSFCVHPLVDANYAV